MNSIRECACSRPRTTCASCSVRAEGIHNEATCLHSGIARRSSLVKATDFSPASSPSLDEQRDALRKGLGRAMLWALDRRLVDESLLAACLRDQRFDKQVEDSRGSWLWQIMQAAGADRFRVPILHELYSLPDDRSVEQLCELARQYAATGDEAFRTRLYEIAEQKPVADSPWLGEEELIELDGETAFLFAAGVRGRQLADRDWEWDDDSLVAHAIERIGEERLNYLLQATTDGAIRRFRENWLQQKSNESERSPRDLHRDRMRAITLDEIIAAAESDSSRYGVYRGWGMYADEADLRKVLQHIRTAERPETIAHLLMVFSNRALPEFDAFLVELCQHSNEDVQWRAFQALQQNEHAAIREFALAGLRDPALQIFAVALFIRNYAKGDEKRILESVELPSDEFELHWLLMDAIKVLEANPQADCSELGLIAYARTPCQNCRHNAARLLLQQQVAPAWMVGECRFDCDAETRALVGEPEVE